MKWANAADTKLIALIAKRAVRVASQAGVDYSQIDAMMDLSACHANDGSLNLKGLLDASPIDFAHDVFGIRLHLDQETGKLMHCFVPRYHQKG